MLAELSTNENKTLRSHGVSPKFKPDLKKPLENPSQSKKKS